MTQGPSEAAPQRRTLPGWGAWLSGIRRSRSIGGSRWLIGPAILLIGLGTVLIAVDATADRGDEPLWLAKLDDGAPADHRRTAQVLSAAAVGWQAQARRIGAERRDGQALADEVLAIGERQRQLADRLRSIERGGSAELVRVRAAVAELAERQARIEARLETDFLTEVVPRGLDGTRVLRLLAAALLLRDGAQSERPFQHELERFAAVAVNLDHTKRDLDVPWVMERVSALRPHAEAGVASWRDLRRSFSSLTVLVDRVDPSTWWQSVLVLVGWRDDPLAPLHQAEAALMVGDLPAAVASLASLEGAAAMVAEGWLSLARARLATDDAVNDLYRLALAAGTALPAAGAVSASSMPGPAATRSRAPASTRPAPWLLAEESDARTPRTISAGSPAR